MGRNEVSWWAWKGPFEDSALEWSVGDEVAYQVKKCRAGSKMYENGKADGACLGSQACSSAEQWGEDVQYLLGNNFLDF